MPSTKRVLRGTAALAAAALAFTPVRGAAQLVEQCASHSGGFEQVQRYCNLVAQTVEISQPRLGLGLSGGDPVAGSASTLGMRLGSPRVAVGVRGTVVVTRIPDIRTESAQGRLTFPLGSIDADAAIGLYSGFSPAPTVGGVGSLDLLGSIGIIPVPNDQGFAARVPVTWGIGARLGLLRESFTAPGISVSAMYRSLGNVLYGDTALQRQDAFFESDLRGVSLRAVAGKSLSFLSLTAGAGYDSWRSDVAFGAVATVAAPVSRFEVRIPATRLTTHRASVFADVGLNFVVLTLVGEVGWQAGTSLPAVPLPQGATLSPRDGAVFGGLALRLTL